ncbi:hypothetical protein I79_023831 [Cricetulus griseus]|uniref:Uncharacterized protein n=1 Tax=Cricetulus griseus TaxID=10029 RepID=G3IJ01_CRIGR|nr:hypothetical protein I79_023831 [Cricetulus griseus]
MGWGLLSRLPSAKAASTWSSLVNDEGTENWFFWKRRRPLPPHHHGAQSLKCKQLPGSEIKGLKDQNHRLVKL